jgi:hypothetical protein
MQAEIMKRIGVPTFDDGIGFGRQRSHSCGTSLRLRIRQVPANGTRSQSGR